jgi:hypothetical protein
MGRKKTISTTLESLAMHLSVATQYHGLTAEQIASLTNISVGSVPVYVSRLRKEYPNAHVCKRTIKGRAVYFLSSPLYVKVSYTSKKRKVA